MMHMLDDYHRNMLYILGEQWASKDWFYPAKVLLPEGM